MAWCAGEHLRGQHCDFFLPRRARKEVGWALLIGVAWLPPVRIWYVGQVPDHAEHVV